MNDLFVNVWEEKIKIPTYKCGNPEKNPMFFEKRVYQGSSGVVYPNPVIEKIYDDREDVEYTALFLENKYLKIMVLPELGGRVQRAYDKVKKRDFIYYNHVIKPALVGLCGPWISGGIEFNWPQHHRPSTFEPVDYTMEENPDGSKTVWVNEIERMFGTKGMAGFTIHPEKAYLEIKAKVYNRTSLPQTFLWWANPAVKVNEHYQSVFPPDVNAVFDHGKRDVTSFPVATGTYYKVDYSPGTDISNYKNIPVPTSYMAVKSDYDFVGGYENDTQAGILHVANHHVSPGKKQWTWGNGDFGKAWDRNLTDDDGPYIELMTGVYTDNQPDFTWLMPYEEKSFVQYFMPYQELGMVKNATKDILVYMDVKDHKARIKVFATSVQLGNQLLLRFGNELIYEEIFDVSPENVFIKEVDLRNEMEEKDLKLIIQDPNGKERITYAPVGNVSTEIPKPAEAALPVHEVESAEQLFLTGLHLEQYRHATYNPVDYYEEALRREPRDARNNNALGKWYLRKGQFVKSEVYLRKAIETYTERNPNPYDGEPYYNLGLSLKFMDRLDEAYEAFYKAVWSGAWQDSGYFSLAQIDLIKDNFTQALEHINWSIDRNARNNKAWVLKAAILRKQYLLEEAIAVSREAVKRDRFNLGAYFELSKSYSLLGHRDNAIETLNELEILSRKHSNSFMEYALDYTAAGLYSEATDLLRLVAKSIDQQPMIGYYLGWIALKSGDGAKANSWFRMAASASSAFCFPNRLEEIRILECALGQNPADAKAPYYLGNLWYDKRQYDDAIQLWEISIKRDDTFATVFRNLGIAYFNKKAKPDLALECFEKAFALDPSDSRVFMERDQLYKRLNRLPEERLNLLEGHEALVEARDDLYLERISLYNFLGEYEKALEQISQRKFHPWEGGEGKVPAQYVYSLIELAKKAIRQHEFERAIDCLKRAQGYPVNLGEGKLIGAKENDLFYWLGCAYQGVGEHENANISFEKATEGDGEPVAAVFYNDQQPDMIFYQGLAWRKLDNEKKAIEIFTKLIAYGQTHINDKLQIDYFAVSLPDMLIFDDNLDIRNEIHCRYIMGLGYLGLGELSDAAAALESVLRKDPIHVGAKTHLAFIKTQEKKVFN